MQDTAIYITWVAFSIIALLFTIVTWIVISKVPSKQNGIHAFVASSLTSRVVFCLSVPILMVAYAFSDSQWNVLACHALYWLWTVSWTSDLLSVIAALIWGLKKLQWPASAFRLASTVAIAGIWLTATTLAGLLTYFNNSIKSIDYIKDKQCGVLPNPDEQSIGVALFVFQCIGVLSSASLCIAFVIKFQIAAQNYKIETEKSRAPMQHSKGLGGGGGQDCVNGEIISQEPGKLEAIEDRKNRRRLKGGGGAQYSELDIELLTCWRSAYCITQSLLLFLNITPQLSFLGMNLFSRKESYNLAVGNMVVGTCHLIYSLLLPLLLVLICQEYRSTLIDLTRCKQDSQPPPEPRSQSIDSGRVRSPVGHKPSVLTIRSANKAMTSPIEVPDVKIQSRPESAAALRVVPRRHSTTARRMSAPVVIRAESGLTRAEWKEQMMGKLKIPISGMSLEHKEEEEKGCEGEAKKEERKMDRKGNLEGEEYRSKSTETYGRTPRQLSISARESDETDSDTGLDTYDDSDIEKVLKRHPSGVDNKGYIEEEEHKRQVQENQTSASQMKEKPAVEEREDPEVSHERNAIVYSQTNPFIHPPQSQTYENESSVSDRSVEAEIVAITIKGKGSLKRKLRDHGLWPGQAAYQHKEDKAFLQSLRLKQKSSYADHYTDLPHALTSSESVINESLNRPQFINTNPFINDIDYTQTQMKVNEEAHFSEIQGWLERVDDPSPPSNFQSDIDGNDHVSHIKKTSSNPFLQDIVEAEIRKPMNFAKAPWVYNEAFQTRSAPCSPYVKRPSTHSLADTIADLLQSRKDGMVVYNTGGSTVRVHQRTRPETTHDPDMGRPHSSCSYLSNRSHNTGGMYGDSLRDGKYITEYV